MVAVIWWNPFRQIRIETTGGVAHAIDKARAQGGPLTILPFGCNCLGLFSCDSSSIRDNVCPSVGWLVDRSVATSLKKCMEQNAHAKEAHIIQPKRKIQYCTYYATLEEKTAMNRIHFMRVQYRTECIQQIVYET